MELVAENVFPFLSNVRSLYVEFAVPSERIFMAAGFL
jgi:hypothetical protein